MNWLRRFFGLSPRAERVPDSELYLRLRPVRDPVVLWYVALADSNFGTETTTEKTEDMWDN